MSSFSAIAFAVTVLSDAIEDAKKQLTDGETEDYAEDVSDEDCECAVCDCVEGEM